MLSRNPTTIPRKNKNKTHSYPKTTTVYQPIFSFKCGLHIYISISKGRLFESYETKKIYLKLNPYSTSSCNGKIAFIVARTKPSDCALNYFYFSLLYLFCCFSCFFPVLSAFFWWGVIDFTFSTE